MRDVADIKVKQAVGRGIRGGENDYCAVLLVNNYFINMKKEYENLLRNKIHPYHESNIQQFFSK